jgi:hypothetical protein
MANEDGTIDFHMFDVPLILRSESGFSVGRYITKLRASATNIQEEGMRREQLPKLHHVLRTDIECLAARYATKLQNGTTDFQLAGINMSTELPLKIPPFSRADTLNSAGRYSRKPSKNTMDFQCKDLVTDKEAPKVKQISRTGTEYSTESTYYPARSRINTMDSAIKRQARTRAATDELSEPSKKVTWNL